MFATTRIARAPRPSRRWPAGLLLALTLTPGAAGAQDGEWSVLPPGRLRLGVVGHFTSADQWFSAGGGAEPLASYLRAGNGATLFPGVMGLEAGLREILGDPEYTPALGATDAYLQASRVRVPFTAELGVTSWFTLGITVPLVKSRLEGEMGLLPAPGADVGVNPAFARYTEVQAFTDALVAAAGSLPAAEAEVWGAWADRWIQAYAASAVFPAEGTAAGAALAASLDAFNAVLSGAGLSPVTAAVPLAETVLTNQALNGLLADPSAHFQLLPLPTQHVWALGDIEVHGRVRIVEGVERPITGRPSFGVTALGSVRLPTGAGYDSRTIYMLPMGEGITGFTAGGAAWLRRGRLGVAAMARYGINGSAEVERRVGPSDVALVPVANLAVVTRDMGNTLEVEFRPSVSPAPALAVEGFYRYFRKEGDRFEATDPLPQPPSTLTPYPSGALYGDVSLLEAATEVTLHLAGGGLRWHPPEGTFPVEVWANVQVAVAGSGGRSLKETRLEFGGRASWQLWGTRQ